MTDKNDKDEVGSLSERLARAFQHADEWDEKNQPLGLREQIDRIREQRHAGEWSLTSVAFKSASAFDATDTEVISRFQADLKSADKGTLFLLADDPHNTAQAGIATTLPPKKRKLLVDVEIAERETKASHERELEVVRERTKGSAWVEVLKYILVAVGGLILGYFGHK